MVTVMADGPCYKVKIQLAESSNPRVIKHSQNIASLQQKSIGTTLSNPMRLDCHLQNRHCSSLTHSSEQAYSCFIKFTELEAI